MSLVSDLLAQNNDADMLRAVIKDVRDALCLEDGVNVVDGAAQLVADNVTANMVIEAWREVMLLASSIDQDDHMAKLERAMMLTRAYYEPDEVG